MFKLNFFRKNKNSGQIWALFGQIKPKIIESVLFQIFWSGTKRVYTLRPTETTRAPLTGIFYLNENIFEN